ncbi:diacylglycerol kinase theta [Ciona intestinalis]
MQTVAGPHRHEPLRRLSQKENLEVGEKLAHSSTKGEIENDTYTVDLSSCFNQFLLPMSYVWLPLKEDGFVSLKQQRSDLSTEPQNQSPGNKPWHHKAIRRNMSKGRDLTLHVGGLPVNLPISAYTDYAAQCTKIDRVTVGPIFPTIGAFFVTFGNGSHASSALKLFSTTRMMGKQATLTMLPYITSPSGISDPLTPLLVFINCKSGGGQGKEVYNELSQFLNKNQIFLIDQAGAAPGFYAFRRLPKFKVLICGGDGTVGWVLSHLELLQRQLQCKAPHIAVLPVGTGNDLARVLGCGSSWNGECAEMLLAQISDSSPVKLDRWNLLFDSIVENNDNNIHPEKAPLLVSDAVNKVKNINIGTELAHSMTSPINIIMSLGAEQQPASKETIESSTDSDNKTLKADSTGFTSYLPPDEALCEENNAEVQTSTHCDNELLREQLEEKLKLDSCSNSVERIPNSALAEKTDQKQNTEQDNRRLLQKSKQQKVEIESRNEEFGPFVKFDETCLKVSSPDGASQMVVESKEDLILDEDEIDELPQFNVGRNYSVVSETYLAEKPPIQLKKMSLPVISSFKKEPPEPVKCPTAPEGLKMVAMNNYFGIGIDAELSLAFHLAREENPERCTSRLRNKALYFKAGLKKMTSRSVNLSNVIELQVDDHVIDLPPIKGLIFLNITSWGAGSNAWGSAVSKRFNQPSIGDGMLEVLGVGGVAHMSQIYSGLRTGMRLAQGEYIRITLKREVAMQVDGEPWMQPPGKIIITVSSMQATMLKRSKRKSK